MANNEKVMRSLFVLDVIEGNLHSMKQDLTYFMQDLNLSVLDKRRVGLFGFGMAYHDKYGHSSTSTELILLGYLVGLREKANQNEYVMALMNISYNKLSNKVLPSFKFQSAVGLKEELRKISDIGNEFFEISTGFDYEEFSTRSSNIELSEKIENIETTNIVFEKFRTFQASCNQIHKLLKEAKKKLKEAREEQERKLKEARKEQERRLKEAREEQEKRIKLKKIEEMVKARKTLASQYIDSENKTLVDQCEEDYLLALKSIDNDVPRLINEGKEMQGLVLFGNNLKLITEVYEVLENLYSVIYTFKDVLNHFDSRKLKVLGYELLPMKSQLEESLGTERAGSAIDEIVVESMNELGIKKEHWYINSRLLTEIEYLIHTLRIMVEPEFIPLETHDSSLEEKKDRYIPKAVKTSVWRRDRAKCVECGSQERLEYDHIIPVAKGGSNTERNVQLLCEKCNRSKAANIVSN